MVRHGRTELNKASNPRLRAWENPGLDQRGKLDAKLAAQMLKPYKPQMIYCSDLTRDSETADIIAGILGNIPWEMNFDFRTANMGELSGLKESEAAPLVDKWYKEPWWPAPSGESNNDFLKRLYPAFDLKFNLAAESEAFCPTVIVSHGRDLAAIHARCDMLPQWESRMPFPGGIMSVSLDERGSMACEFLSDTEPVQADV
jgi:broad specificity phosphatase PhoE